MQIKLMIEEKERIFVASFIPARAFRKLLEIRNNVDLANLTAEQLDEIVGLISNSIFKSQFTIDEFYDGLDSRELLTIVGKVFTEVSGTGSNEGNVPKG
jgi:hypothetical protein